MLAFHLRLEVSDYIYEVDNDLTSHLSFKMLISRYVKLDFISFFSLSSQPFFIKLTTADIQN